ncbi:MAG: nucleotidyltransferase family protein [Steroidobacteraceae bacterium]
MTSANLPLPTLAVLEAALRSTTERFASELACPSDAPPDWSEAEWRTARSSAAMHGVCALLARRLRWHGPQSWKGFLDEQLDHSIRRYQRIAQLLDDLDREARRQGVGIIPLKGAALYTLGVYAQGERPMSDIDLLARHADLAPVTRLLEQLGYHEAYVMPRHRVFVPRDGQAILSYAEHSGNSINIELHTSILEKLPVAAADISQQLFPRRLHPGSNSYPSTAALMKHLLLHAAGNIRARALRLIHLYEIALLSSVMRGTDWHELLGQRADWWMSPPLVLTARYFPQAVDPSVLAASERHCPRLLRSMSRNYTLTDVSLSQLWVSAFPGIEWSTSGREALQYIFARIKPGRQVMAERRDVVAVQRWAGDSSWSNMSQSMRILRWLISRPARPETLYSVREAWNSVS